MGINEGLFFASGSVEEGVGPNNNGSITVGGGNIDHSDPDLEMLSDGPITDAAVLEFDFVPSGDSLKFSYVFASDEYPEFVCSYNDAFGFFLSGPGISGPYTNNAINIALVPTTTMPVLIPIRTLKSSPCRLRMRRRRGWIPSRMSKAASTARCASSSCARGDPNTAYR